VKLGEMLGAKLGNLLNLVAGAVGCGRSWCNAETFAEIEILA
jgi:hypothetical protein